MFSAQNSLITWRHMPHGEIADATSLQQYQHNEEENRQTAYVTTARAVNERMPSLCKT